MGGIFRGKILFSHEKGIDMEELAGETWRKGQYPELTKITGNKFIGTSENYG